MISAPSVTTDKSVERLSCTLRRASRPCSAEHRGTAGRAHAPADRSLGLPRQGRARHLPAELPDIARSRVLLRAPDDDGARDRLATQVLTAHRVRRLGPAELALAMDDGQAHRLAGDLLAPGLGRSELSPPRASTSSIHCAASVSFEQPLDEMLELNGWARPRWSTRSARPARPSTSCTSPPPTPRASAPASCSSARPAPRRASPARPRRRARRGARVAPRPRGRVAPARAPASLRQGGRARRSRPRRRPRRRRAGRAAAPRLGRASSSPSAAASARARSAGSTPTGSRRRSASGRCSAAEPRRPDDRAPDDRRVRAAHALPGLDRGAEGRRPDPARLRRRASSPRFPGNRSIRIDIMPVDFVANACLAAAAHPPSDGPSHDERGQRHAATRSRSATTWP